MKSQAQDVVADLTRLLESLPLHDAAYAPPTIPTNGIYFFYEAGEKWPRGSALTAAQRVVRIGSHSGDNNLRTRIGNHFQATRRRSTEDFAARHSEHARESKDGSLGRTEPLGTRPGGLP